MTEDRDASRLEDLLPVLLSAADSAGTDAATALAEKVQELIQRAFLRCIPNPSLRHEQVPGFLALVLGEEPDADLVERAQLVSRRRRLNEEEVLLLEARQNLRCALCGVVLVAGANPHIDHIRPISLGGDESLSNLQLLCRTCNLGKNDLYNWILGIPFQEKRITSRMRYCTLARYHSRCQQSGCTATSLSAELVVTTIIRWAEGGRFVFDNLTVLCRSHATKRDQQQREKALQSLRFTRHRTRRPLDLSA